MNVHFTHLLDVAVYPSGEDFTVSPYFQLALGHAGTLHVGCLDRADGGESRFPLRAAQVQALLDGRGVTGIAVPFVGVVDLEPVSGAISA